MVGFEQMLKLSMNLLILSMVNAFSQRHYWPSFKARLLKFPSPCRNDLRGCIFLKETNHWMLVFFLLILLFKKDVFSNKASILEFLDIKAFFCEFYNLVVACLQVSWKLKAGFELAVRNSQFAKRFGNLQMNFCIFSENCKSLKSDTLWIFRVIHWTTYIVSYFKPIKYSLLNNNVISQRFIIHISPN